MTKQLLIGILATFLTFGLFGTAFSSPLISPHSSEAGVYEFNFNAPETKANMAAKNYVYDSEKLAKQGTKAGVWEHDFNAPETEADLAAKNHVYDEQTLSEIGTEAGANDRSVICATC